MARSDIALFAMRSSWTFGEKVAARLGVPLAAHEERDFEDGEHKSRSLVNVRGRDSYVIHSLHGDAEESANDKLCRLLFFIGALKDAAAARVTAVVPYLAYGRKDRKTKPRDPVTTRYLAALFEAVGTDRVMTLEAHNVAAFQNAFRCRTEHLDTAGLFARHLAPLLGDRPVSVVSPDAGGLKRAERFRTLLAAALGRDVGMAFVEKYRSAGVVSGGTLVGDVKDRSVIVLDDLISTGTTMLRAARACRERGAAQVLAAAAHGLFVGEASAVLHEPALDRVAVTNSVPAFRLDPELLGRKVTVVDASELVAEAIRRAHEGGSIVELLEP